MNDTRVSSVICESMGGGGQDKVFEWNVNLEEVRVEETKRERLTSTGIDLASAPTRPSDFLNERSAMRAR